LLREDTLELHAELHGFRLCGERPLSQGPLLRHGLTLNPVELGPQCQYLLPPPLLARPVFL